MVSCSTTRTSGEVQPHVRSRVFIVMLRQPGKNEPELARELQAGLDAAVETAAASDFIASYADALPHCDSPRSAVERKSDYRERLKKLDHFPCSRQSRGLRCKNERLFRRR